MKGTFKILPYIVGLFIGLMIFHPPAALKSFGYASYLIMFALGLALFLGFIMISINNSFPKTLVLAPSNTARMSEEAMRRIQEMEAAGFRRLQDYPIRVGLTPPAYLIPYIHESARTYATVFQTTTIPSVSSFDMFSYFQGIEGGLTTSPTPRGGVLPVSRNSFRQIFPGQSVAYLFDRHKEAIAFLKNNHLECRPITGENFDADYKAAFARMRSAFKSN
ncbi:MAG TPA: hypothetical protein VFG11_01740, partial [Acidobacteriota bacterium]|nr:hypothetical protein [Acidobacteriota bacterium]